MGLDEIDFKSDRRQIKKERNDNAIVASPFFGTNDITKITVNGQLNYCYFLKGTGTWIDDGAFINKDPNKVPVGLSFD